MLQLDELIFINIPGTAMDGKIGFIEDIRPNKDGVSTYRIRYAIRTPGDIGCSFTGYFTEDQLIKV